jgi:hypothetical protein
VEEVVEEAEEEEWWWWGEVGLYNDNQCMVDKWDNKWGKEEDRLGGNNWLKEVCHCNCRDKCRMGN